MLRESCPRPKAILELKMFELYTNVLILAYDVGTAGHKLRCSAISAQPGIHDHRRAHVGSRYWCDDGDLQPCLRHSPSSITVPTLGATGCNRNFGISAGRGATNPAGADRIGSSYPNFFDWRQRNHTFESLASYDETVRLFSKMNGDGARVIPGARVSANLFSTLGVAPALGRTFTEEEEQPGHRVVILSHELWASDFASSPNVIGETVKISDEPSIVVGVMPAGFHYPIGDPVLFLDNLLQQPPKERLRRILAPRRRPIIHHRADQEVG